MGNCYECASPRDIYPRRGPGCWDHRNGYSMRSRKSKDHATYAPCLNIQRLTISNLLRLAPEKPHCKEF